MFSERLLTQRTRKLGLFCISKSCLQAEQFRGADALLVALKAFSPDAAVISPRVSSDKEI